MIDTVLDRSIALGYGNVGLAARRRLPGWPADLPRMDGATVLVTGAASGLGLASAIGFARLGATVHALARSEPRALEAVDRITEAVPDADARPASCDVSDLNALRVFAGHFAEREPRLEVLVNNAGVMPDDRTASADGHELMFATHVLAPLGLTALAERLRDRGILVHAMHPGWADTEGVRRWMPVFRTLTRPIIRSPDQGADTIVWLGAAPEPLRETGLFWQDRRPRPSITGSGRRPAASPTGRRSGATASTC